MLINCEDRNICRPGKNKNVLGLNYTALVCKIKEYGYTSVMGFDFLIKLNPLCS